MIILLALYLASCLYNYIFLREAYVNPFGAHYGQEATGVDLIMCFLPPINFFTTIYFLIHGWEDQ